MHKNQTIIQNGRDVAISDDKKELQSEYSFESIYDFENLYKAHKLARLGKQSKKEVIEYELYLAENLKRLEYHLKNKTYAIKGYRKFVIHDPKTREIQALSYGDMVLQHSLCDNVLGPYLEQRRQPQ